VHSDCFVRPPPELPRPLYIPFDLHHTAELALHLESPLDTHSTLHVRMPRWKFNIQTGLAANMRHLGECRNFQGSLHAACDVPVQGNGSCLASSAKSVRAGPDQRLLREALQPRPDRVELSASVTQSPSVPCVDVCRETGPDQGGFAAAPCVAHLSAAGEQRGRCQGPGAPSLAGCRPGKRCSSAGFW